MMLFLLAQATSPTSTSQVSATAPAQDIVVTARRYRDELKACIAKSCPPEQEVEAAMNAAAETFRMGRYEEAKSMLARTISRNKQYAGRMPGKMSDLYATYADVANHEGDEDNYIRATYDSIAVLHRYAGKDHPATQALAARTGDMMVELGRKSEAERIYRSAADAARVQGNDRLATILTFRSAWLASRAGNYATAEKLLKQMEGDATGDKDVAALTGVLRAQIAVQRKQGTLEQVAEASRKLGGNTPILIYSPDFGPMSSYPAEGRDTAGRGSALEPSRDYTLGDDHDYRYADVGYWIRPDGSTGDAAVIQSKGGQAWAAPILKQIAGRRYTPMKVFPGSPGVYRLERYTLRPTYGIPIGSHIRMRIGPPTLHVIDMTTAPTSSPVAPS